MSVEILFTEEDRAAALAIINRVPGYSGGIQYYFFKTLLLTREFDSMLMLGVYHGLDICFILDILARYHPGRVMHIVGVDKFTDTPCADWPDAVKGKSWKEAGFGQPPSLEGAKKNISAYVGAALVDIVQADDAEFMATTEQRYGCCYYDTSHDAPTLLRQLGQAKRIAEGDAILCGDDWSDQGTWGVQKAVKEAFTSYGVFADYVWRSNVRFLK